MNTRILILGGGFAGVYTALDLQKYFRKRSDVEITLVSRNNYFVMTPLLFEAGSGVLEPRHAVNPIRPLFDRAHFIEAETEQIDLDQRIVHARLAHREVIQIPYDHVVLALGGVTNTRLIPGSEHALTFKTLADAIHLRNRTIQLLEQADVESHPDQRRALLTFVIVGGGLVGLELQGELTEFVDYLLHTYRGIKRDEIHFELIEAHPRIAPEFEPELADYAARVLARRGVNIRTSTKVASIEPGRLHLPTGETITAQTIIVATGVIPNPLVAALPLEKNKHGAVMVEPTLKVAGRDGIWALGDCASIPDPSGKPYPPLAQHALRKARTLARNIAAAIESRPLVPFVYRSKGSLAALGHYKGIGLIFGFRVRGFLAWWIWRSYYLFKMPQWRRRLRIMIDWSVALLFGMDVVQLDLARPESSRGVTTPAEPREQAAATKPEIS